jgi:histidyl-tRNA synthetase
MMKRETDKKGSGKKDASKRGYRAPRGTRDILPEDISLWRKVENTARCVLELYGYEEIRTPAFEETQLFVRGIGEATDIVEKEMYTFRLKSGESITLRPEMTAPIVRALLEHHLYRQKRFRKFYYIGPFFRYERPQAGRSRQFHQIGIEALGSLDPLLDVETVQVASQFFDELGFRRLRIVLNSIGCHDCRPGYREILKRELGPSIRSLCESCQNRYERNVFRILDCKREACREITRRLPSMEEHLCPDCGEHFERVQEGLRATGVTFDVDPHLVRGFDYYTRTVYEIQSDLLGAQDALGGGGRYDDLVADMGGPAMGAVGFALGVERILLAYREEVAGGAAKPETGREGGLFVAVPSPEARFGAFRLISELRRSGIPSFFDYEGRSLKAQMRTAHRMKCRWVAFVGSDEEARGLVKLKVMETGEERLLNREELVSELLSPGAQLRDDCDG